MTDKMPPLAMWTVYAFPADYPDKYVARKHLVTAGGPIATQETRISESIDTIRRAFGLEGLYLIPRSDGDEPQIIESWL